MPEPSHEAALKKLFPRLKAEERRGFAKLLGGMPPGQAETALAKLKSHFDRNAYNFIRKSPQNTASMLRSVGPEILEKAFKNFTEFIPALVYSKMPPSEVAEAFQRFSSHSSDDLSTIMGILKKHDLLKSYQRDVRESFNSKFFSTILDARADVINELQGRYGELPGYTLMYFSQVLGDQNFGLRDSLELKKIQEVLDHFEKNVGKSRVRTLISERPLVTAELIREHAMRKEWDTADLMRSFGEFYLDLLNSGAEPEALFHITEHLASEKPSERKARINFLYDTIGKRNVMRSVKEGHDLEVAEVVKLLDPMKRKRISEAIKEVGRLNFERGFVKSPAYATQLLHWYANAPDIEKDFTMSKMGFERMMEDPAGSFHYLSKNPARILNQLKIMHSKGKLEKAGKAYLDLISSKYREHASKWPLKLYLDLFNVSEKTINESLKTASKSVDRNFIEFSNRVDPEFKSLYTELEERFKREVLSEDWARDARRLAMDRFKEELAGVDFNRIFGEIGEKLPKGANPDNTVIIGIDKGGRLPSLMLHKLTGFPTYFIKVDQGLKLIDKGMLERLGPKLKDKFIIFVDSTANTGRQRVLIEKYFGHQEVLKGKSASARKKTETRRALRKFGHTGWTLVADGRFADIQAGWSGFTSLTEDQVKLIGVDYDKDLNPHVVAHPAKGLVRNSIYSTLKRLKRNPLKRKRGK